MNGDTRIAKLEALLARIKLRASEPRRGQPRSNNTLAGVAAISQLDALVAGVMGPSSHAPIDAKPIEVRAPSPPPPRVEAKAVEVTPLEVAPRPLELENEPKIAAVAEVSEARPITKTVEPMPPTTRGEELERPPSGEYPTTDAMGAEEIFELEELGPADELIEGESVVEIDMEGTAPAIEIDRTMESRDTEPETEPEAEDADEAPPQSGRELVGTPRESQRIAVASPARESALDEAPELGKRGAWVAGAHLVPDVAAEEATPVAADDAPATPTPPRVLLDRESVHPPTLLAGVVESGRPSAPSQLPRRAIEDDVVHAEPAAQRPLPADLTPPPLPPPEPPAAVDTEPTARPAVSMAPVAPAVAAEQPSASDIVQAPVGHAPVEDAANAEPSAAEIVQAPVAQAPVVVLDAAPIVEPAVAPVIEAPVIEQVAMKAVLEAPGAHAATTEQPVVVAIGADVIKPSRTPAEVASIVGAARTFKPETFGALLDAALDL